MKTVSVTEFLKNIKYDELWVVIPASFFVGCALTLFFW